MRPALVSTSEKAPLLAHEANMSVLGTQSKMDCNHYANPEVLRASKQKATNF
jgi:hypothetical protein